MGYTRLFGLCAFPGALCGPMCVLTRAHISACTPLCAQDTNNSCWVGGAWVWNCIPNQTRCAHRYARVNTTLRRIRNRPIIDQPLLVPLLQCDTIWACSRQK